MGQVLRKGRSGTRTVGARSEDFRRISGLIPTLFASSADVPRAQEAPPHTAVDAMHYRHLGRVEQISARQSSHGNHSRQASRASMPNSVQMIRITSRGRMRIF